MVHLTQEQKKFYDDNGYIVLKGIFSEAELSEMSSEYDALFARKNGEHAGAKLESSWVGSDDCDRQTDTQFTVKGIHNLQYHAAVFGRMLYNEALLDAVEDVIGSQNIVLHHTKAHMKPPEKGAAYPMHQDYHYFPYEKDSMVAAFIHLDAASPENGGLHVYPGSHKLGPLEDVATKEGSNFHYVDQKKYPLEKAQAVIAACGDVVLFSYLLVHGSSRNSSDRRRRMLLVQMAAAEDRPVGVQRPRPAQGLLLRGVNVQRDASIAKRFE